MSHTNDKTDLKHPNPPVDGQKEASKTSQASSSQLAKARGTEVVNAARNSLNSQVARVGDIAELYQEAATPIIEQSSDMLALCISGEWFWGEVIASTKEKLSALPKPEAVSLTLAQDLSRLGLRSLPTSKGNLNRYLASSRTSLDAE
jgi:hypothetical protein